VTHRRSSLLSLLASAAGVALCIAPAAAQVASKPVGQDSGPVSEITRGVKEDSGPVFGDGGPVRGLSVEAGSDGPVRGSTSGTVRTGAIKDVTVGSVRTQLPPGFYAPLQREEAAEMRIDDFEEPEPPPAAETVWDLRPLADTMRRIQPLPEHEPAADGTAEEDVAQAAEALADEIEVPQVENADDVDPSKPEPPMEPGVQGPGGVFMPATPDVGAPSEVVPIPMPGSTPAPNYD